MTLYAQASSVHPGWALASVIGAALVAALASVLVALITNRKTRAENSEQHARAQEERQKHQDELLAALERQDHTRGRQVDGIHTELGKIDGKLDAHMSDPHAHPQETRT